MEKLEILEMPLFPQPIVHPVLDITICVQFVAKCEPIVSVVLFVDTRSVTAKIQSF